MVRHENLTSSWWNLAEGKELIPELRHSLLLFSQNLCSRKSRAPIGAGNLLMRIPPPEEREEKNMGPLSNPALKSALCLDFRVYEVINFLIFKASLN